MSTNGSLEDMRRRIEQLPAAERAQLWQRMWERGITSPLSPDADPGREVIAPASFTQRRMVVLHEMDPLSLAYNSPAPVALHGPIDPALIEAVLNDIIRRHSALRTSLPVIDGEPVQRVLPHERRRLVVVDVSGLPPGRRDAESERLVLREQGVPFRLETGPLVRFHLVLRSATDALMLTTFHHAVVDGWSLAVFARELAEFYRARLRGEPAEPAPLRLQYADYARWQQDWLQTAEAQRQKAYWVDRLAGAAERSGPAPDHPRSAAATRHGEVHHFVLPPAVTEGVRELARSAGATPFMVLLAAFQAVLARWSGSDDVLVGTPVANRRYREFHDLLGFFVNSLIIRGRPYGHTTFADYVGQVRDACLDAYDNQDLPVDVLAQLLYPERQAGRNPLYQVNLAFHNTPEAIADADGLTVVPLDRDRNGARFDLDLVVLESDAGLECSLIYAAELYDESTARRLASSLEVLLSAGLAVPATPLERLPVVSDEQWSTVLSHAVGATAPRPADMRLHRLFEEQVERSPDAIAVSDPTAGEVSYRGLTGWSDAVAQHLVAQGVRRGDFVAVLLDRSAAAVAAMLGVLKAGAAYVPLDTAYPQARINRMIADSGTHVLITSPSRKDVAEDVEVLIAADLCEPDAPPVVHGDDGDVAYLMYTSGSTGTPKGTMVAHRQVANYLLWAIEQYRVGDGDADRVPLHSPLGFDLTVTSVFAPLLCGRRIVVPDDDGTPGEGLVRWSRRTERASFVKLTPSHLKLLSDIEQTFRADALVIGGEMLHGNAVASWLADPEHPRLFNEYGPTETSVACTAYEVTGPIDGAAQVPIGRPIDNMRVYVLDELMQPVPIGVPGELYVGGLGVSYGYWRRGGQTAERFLPDPFGPDGARLYRTGDSVVLRDDGELVYLGRRDRQVKVRGHRIEPDEVAATITSAPPVRHAVVDLVDDQLVAFVELAEPEAGTGGERVEQWRMLYEDTYREFEEPVPAVDPEVAMLTGWTSTYTGRPIDPAEMGQWLDETVERILALRPRDALEIGAGTGMIAGRVAPECRSYRATDFAAPVVEHLRRTVGQRPGVSCAVAPAHRAVQPGDHFDLAILNSVIQYFPSADYLLEVLDSVVAALAPGGRIFLGDVRNNALQEMFWTGVRMAQAAPATRVDVIRAQVQVDLDNEEELCVDPRLFGDLGRRWPRLGLVRVLPRSGRYDNELSRYRYDVVLSFDQPVPESGAPAEWAAGEQLREAPDRLLVRGMPHPLLGHDRRLVTTLAAAPDAATAGFVADQASAGEPGPELAGLLATAEAAGYAAEVSWSAGHPDGAVDVLLERPAVTDARMPAAAPADPALLTSDPLWRERRLGSVEQVGRFVADRLPDAMRPSAYHLVRTMPLTPNGKIDLGALRRRRAVAGDAGPVRPAAGRELTPAEYAIAAVWEQVLNRSVTAPDDDFFDLGGHSLLTFQVLHRLRDLFGVDIPTRTMFERRTLADLATAITDLRVPESETGPVTTDDQDHRPLSFAQERLWFLYQLDPSSAQYNVPLFIELSGPVDVVAMARAVRVVADRHDILRTVLPSDRGRPYQYVLPPGSNRLRVIDVSHLPADTGDRLAGSAARQPFDLATEPALKAWLIRHAPQRHTLMLLLHHIAYDGWSAQILLDEVAAAYTASPRPDLRSQYADFARRERRAHHDQHRQYWRERLSGILDIPGIPLDRPRPPRPTYAGAATPFRVPEDVTSALRRFSQRDGTTVFMVLLAAAFGAMHATTGQTDAVVCIDVANRPDVDAEALIGFFVNQVLVRLDLTGDPTPAELVRRVRVACLDAYAHQELPYEQVVRIVNPRRNREAKPLFQVKVSLNQAPREPDLPGITAALMETDVMARADIGLNFEEDADGGLRGVLEYATELFDDATTATFLDRYLAVLRQVALGPDTPLSTSYRPGGPQ